MNMIQDENVKAISLGVLQQIDLDLVQCEQFAASEPIQGLEVWWEQVNISMLLFYMDTFTFSWVWQLFLFVAIVLQ